MMIDETIFDDIRPYRDEEIPAAMHRIADNDLFPLLSSFAFPDRNVEDVRAEVRSISTVYDFQKQMMWYVNEQIVKRSMSSYTVSGIENLDPSGHYLFVSNHRDIMLDASVLQNVLHAHGFQTSEITFGANLMSSSLVIDIGKSNKMFKVERGGNMKDFYKSSVHLSEYIRHVVTEKGESVWIAQRNGRTKDGNDATDQGIIKMFGISKREDKIKALSELNIVPLSISYEWETCDYMKALELYQSRSEKYVKKRGEDITFLRRIVRGPADDSYGIEVAKLAGLPGTVTRRAHEVLRTLEASAPKNKVEQMDFDALQEYNSPAVPSEVLEKLDALDVETLTPIEALNFLYELKKTLKGSLNG